MSQVKNFRKEYESDDNEEKLFASVVTGARKVIAIALALFLIVVIVLFHHHFQLRYDQPFSVMTFLSLPFGYLLFKVVLSFFYQPIDIPVTTGEDAFPFTVSAVMPCYNESAKSVLMAIESLLSQTYPLKEIFFIDDGSSEQEAYEAVLDFITHYDGNVKLAAHRLPENSGKVYAQVWGFEQATSDLIMAVDSDGSIAPNGVEELVKVFAKDEKVGSVAGYVAARNVGESFVTTVQDINYSGAFSVGRAAQSVFNSVVICSGALSLHRRAIIMENLDKYLDETALRIAVRSGDDRRLTRISKQSGWKTKYQATAICYTDVPNHTKKFIRQRVRWTRSAWLYSIQNFGVVSWKRLVYILFSFMESYLWLITLILWFLFSRNIETSLDFWLHALIYYVLMNYLNTVYYIFHKPIRYILSPIHSLFYGVTLIWIYIKTVVLLFNGKWGTR